MIPQNTCAICVICSANKPVHEMFRMVSVKGGRVRLDETMSEEGEAVHICRSRTCLKAAQKRRTAKEMLGVPETPDLYLKAAKLLRKPAADIPQLLHFAIRARVLVSGSGAVQDSLTDGDACLVLIDPSISQASRERIENRSRAAGVDYLLLPEAHLLEEITGKPNLRVAAVTNQNFTGSILKSCTQTDKE